MAIKSRRNFKTLYGAGDLTLEAHTGESILITDVKIYEPTAVYANFLIERTAVGYYRVGGALGSHLHFHQGRAEHAHDLLLGAVQASIGDVGSLLTDAGGDDIATIAIPMGTTLTNYERAMVYHRDSDSKQGTILKYLWEKGIFKGFPVAEGETFTIELITGATAWKMVEYDIYDAEDIKSDQENGSMSKTYMYINYGDCNASIQAAADNLLTTPNNPTEYPDFPFGGIVPSGHKIELLGILASDVAPIANDGTDYTYTEYLKFMQGREILFDEDHNGLLYCAQFINSQGSCNMIAEGYAVGGNYTQCDRKEPHMFDPPIVFNEGEELTVSWHVEIGVGGQEITVDLHEVGLILRISPIV